MPASSASKLADRAAAFEHTVESSLTDEQGLLYTLIDARTMRPFPVGFFDHGKDIFRYPGADYGDFTEFLKYENAGMVTGAHLCAQVWKRRATGAAGALAKARRCFQALRRLFDLSQSAEEGYFCKPYGGKVTAEHSSDQYLYTLVALDEYIPHAGPDEREQAKDMIAKMVRWWMRHDYRSQYFGRWLDWPPERFPVFAWLAYRHSGERAFAEEFERLCSLPETRTKIPFLSAWPETVADAARREPQFEIERRTGKRVLWMDRNRQSALLSLEPLLKHDAPHRELWLAKLKQVYEEGLHGMAPDGLVTKFLLVDPETEEAGELQEMVSTGEGGPEWQFAHLVGWVRSGTKAAFLARALLAVDSWFPELEARSPAARILHALDHDRLRSNIDVGDEFPATMKWQAHAFSGDAIATWLWTYWEGCARYGREWADGGSAAADGET